MLEKSGSEFADSAGKRQIVENGSQKDAEELGNTGKEQVGFGSRSVECFSALKAEDSFEGTNGTLDGGTFGIQPVPFL